MTGLSCYDDNIHIYFSWKLHTLVKSCHSKIMPPKKNHSYCEMSRHLSKILLLRDNCVLSKHCTSIYLHNTVHASEPCRFTSADGTGTKNQYQQSFCDCANLLKVKQTLRVLTLLHFCIRFAISKYTGSDAHRSDQSVKYRYCKA
jgi:hypothetical protein